MTKNTNLLINELTNISKDVDSKYSKYNIVKEIDKKKAKMAENKNIENNLKNNILHGKNIINHNKNIIDMLKIQKEKLEKIINEETNEKSDEYNKNLQNLISKEDKLKKEVLILNNIKDKHNKLCDKKIEDLTKIMKIVQNEYDYESKRHENNNKEKNINKKSKLIKNITINNMKNKNTYNVSKSSSFINNKNSPLPKINKNKSQLFIGKNDNKENNILEKNKSLDLSDKNILKDPIRNELSNIKSISTKNNNMEKDLFEMKKQILKKIKYKFLNNSINKNITSNININNININEINTNNSNNSNDSNFVKTDMSFFSKVVPSEYIDKFKKKFSNIQAYGQISKEKQKEFLLQKKLNSQKKNEIELTELKKKVSIQTMIKLHSKLSEMKKNVNILKIENKNMYKKYLYIKRKYKKKKDENEKMMKYFHNLYIDIKNNKITLKKGNKLNKDDENAINKWGGPIDLFIIKNDESSNNGENNENEKENEEEEEEVNYEENENEIDDN